MAKTTSKTVNVLRVDLEALVEAGLILVEDDESGRLRLRLAPAVAAARADDLRRLAGVDDLRRPTRPTPREPEEP